MLTLKLYSFSYHKTPRLVRPDDHGGGFEFDCRCLPNPGRDPRFLQSTGLDPEVRMLLDAESSCRSFLMHAEGLVEIAVSRYLERGFECLSIGFGCTGGQHRSVYCASKCAEKWSQQVGVKVELTHFEFPNFEWLE